MPKVNDNEPWLCPGMARVRVSGHVDVTPEDLGKAFGAMGDTEQAAFMVAALVELQSDTHKAALIFQGDWFGLALGKRTDAEDAIRFLEHVVDAARSQQATDRRKTTDSVPAREGE